MTAEHPNFQHEAVERPELPEELIRIASAHAGPTVEQIRDMMRPPELCATPVSLNAQKATRLSFTQLLARRMIAERWKLTKRHVEIDANGCGHLIYQIDFGRYQATYLVQSFPPVQANENYGRRAGAKRDVWGTLFAGLPSAERIKEQIGIIGPRDIATIRARSDILGLTPGSRSARIFDDVVDALSKGRQPEPDVFRKSGYLIRNGGFVGSGRFGTISYPGIPVDHPLKYPYFADLFGLLLLREVGFDLVNEMAAARSKAAVRLSDRLATFFGVGNASGQGMCVALMRWPQWVSTWLVTREFCLARAKLMPATPGSAPWRHLLDLLDRAVMYYDFDVPDPEEFAVPHKEIAENLRIIVGWMRGERDGANWAVLAERVTAAFDGETAELFNALLIEIYPQFADDVSAYIPVGMAAERDYSPELPVGEFRQRFLSKYRWELDQDLTNSDARRHFWYHSIENGEQRRGERVIDPHEHFESFVDQLGHLQRLASVLTRYPEDTPMGQVILDHSDLAFIVSRVEMMAHRPYKEIQGNLIHKDFSPAHLIRFLLAVLGLESTNPSNMRWVPGVLFQGLPSWEQIETGALSDWKFCNVKNLKAAA